VSESFVICIENFLIKNVVFILLKEHFYIF